MACCSTLNDDYFEGFITFFYSLRKHNPGFNCPYYIFTWGDLSQQNIDTLKTIYSSFIFKHTDNDLYNKCQYTNDIRKWNINCNNRFDIFTLEEYDKAIFFDADMLCLGDITDLFNINVSFGACTITKGSELDHPGRDNKHIKSFDGGLMVISKKYLTKKTREDLLEIAHQKKWSSDEPILNVYFDNIKTTFLPKKYNTLTSELTVPLLHDAKIIQFIDSKKPWFSGNIHDKYTDYVIKKIGYKLVVKIDKIFNEYFKNAKKQYNISNSSSR